MTTTPLAPDLLVLSPVDVKDDDWKNITAKQELLDGMDSFNHPRIRRIHILEALRQKASVAVPTIAFECVSSKETHDAAAQLDAVYSRVHSTGLVQFLSTAWDRWESYGSEGQDPSGCLSSLTTTPTVFVAPPAVPVNMPLQRELFTQQRPSKHVSGQMGYYCTDSVTPIFDGLLKELANDAALVQQATAALAGAISDDDDANNSTSSAEAVATVFILPTHPGHHSTLDCFGGYCYLNHAAATARLLQQQQHERVAVLDVDYHCGNGTASTFYNDPTVLVVSLHCDPDFEYPFHSGFADETGSGEGVGATMHLPLPPGTAWNEYEVALLQGLHAISDFRATAVIVSLGLDTYNKDPCAIRRAGFCLQGDDYKEMGRVIGKALPKSVPIVFVQEGGYRMVEVGKAAADVVVTCAMERRGM
jgi:acetoin utilization deacetylase AcuC-like enzyme